MKNLFYVILICLAFPLLHAQDPYGMKSPAGSAGSSSAGKEAFIKNQDYLSSTSLKNYRNIPGDSLAGFDESALRTKLLYNNVFGEEYMNYMNVLKRQFINDKYKIGARYLPQSVPAVAGNGRLNRPAYINSAPCVNEDFEMSAVGPYFGAGNATAISGWTISSGQNSCNATTSEGMPVFWNAGSPEVWVLQTPILSVPFIGNIPTSPLGGSKVLQLQNQFANGLCTKLAQTFPVTAANSLFQFAFAGAYQDGTHDCCNQPFLKIRMFDCLGAPLSCSSLSLNPPGANCSSGASGYTLTSGVSWTNWQVKYIDLTPYIGSCVTLEVITSDCAPTGHWGTTYFDARCGGSLLCPPCGIGGTTSIAGPVSFCAGSNQAVISAPPAYATYSWVAPSFAPPIPVNQATLSTLTIPSPIANAVYTVYMTSFSGCQFISTNTLSFSSVNIAGIASNTSCIGGASGSATVVGNGSGTGYNFTWINAATNLTVGTSSTTGIQGTINGLAPGVYSVVATGLGAAGCGSAVATTTVVNGPPGVIELLKPFCGTQAYFTTAGGSNFQWYNGTTPVSAGNGGIASSFTLTNPTNLGNVIVTYTSPFGCRDSVKYTLIASTPGQLTIPNVSWICPGGTNGTALINMVPAIGSPGGLNSFSVFNLSPTPAYSASLFPTSATQFSLSSLAAGTYSVNAFDGSCKYGANFTVNAYTYAVNASPAAPVFLCPGNNIAAGVSFSSAPSASQYTYSWTPTTWLAGTPPASGTYSSTIVFPNIPVGSPPTTIVYTVVVTPSLVNCPTVRTITITAISPPTPSITAIPDQCNSFVPYQIQPTPTGGTFVTTGSGPSPIGSTSGILTPSLAGIGVNSFVYSIKINTCVASQTFTYHVSQFRSAALTSSVPNLCVTNPAFNLMNIVLSSAGGTWFPAQNSITPPAALIGNQFIPTNLVTNTYPITYSTTSTPLNTCPDWSTIPVQVTKTITPFITPVPPFCTNAAPKNMTVSPTGGAWYNNSAISSAGILNPSPAAVPSSVAFYSVQIGPCVNTASLTLNTSTFNPAGFTSTISHLCNQSPAINLMSIAQTTIGNWTAPLGVTNVPNGLVGNTLNPLNVLTGVYTLTYTTASWPTAGLCDDRRTLDVYILHPEISQISNVRPFCSTAAPVQLTVSAATGYWTSSAYLSPSGVFSPSLASVGNNPVQYIVGTNTCNVQQTKFVGVEAFVPAKITSALPDQCSNSSPISLVPFTMSSLGAWSGPGIAGNTFNPALTGSGTFTLVHNTASSPSGLCPDVDAIAVNVYSLATPEITKAGPLCNNALPFQLNVSPVGGFFGGANAGLISLDGKFNPASANIGNNIITYSIMSGPCIAYAQATINIEKFITAAFDRSVAPICLDPAKVNPINMNSYVQNPGGTWSGPGISGNMFNPMLANKGKNNTIVYNTQSQPTALCRDKSEIVIEVRDLPVVTGLTNINEACVPAEVIFNTPNVMEGVGVGTWTFDDGSEPANGLTVSHIYTTPGTYNVTFSYKDDIGCEALPAKVNPVIVREVPKADFSIPEEVYISNPDVQLTNLSTSLGNNTYQWKIGNLYTMDMVNPVVSLPKIGRYQITLIATAGKCSDQITKTLEVKNDFNIYIPSSFSPNFDGLNDIFIPVFSEYGLDLKSFEMEIFDRWGHSLYRTKDVTKGWDGSVQNKGETVKEGSYIYKMKYKDLDGNSYEKDGQVTVLGN